jgi:hypothetical protein
LTKLRKAEIVKQAIRSPSPLESPSPERLDIDEFFGSQRWYVIGRASSLHRDNSFNPHFVKKLTYELRLLREKGVPSRRIYGDEADDSRLGHTPPETQARFDSDEANRW